MDGAVHEAEKRASVTGLATLDYKRTITELVKTTVYDAVVPFLPQAPVWGSLTGVRPAKVIVFDADKLGTSSEHKAKRFIDERESAK